MNQYPCASTLLSAVHPWATLMALLSAAPILALPAMLLLGQEIAHAADVPPEAASGKGFRGKWFRGQLHTHSFWSDGRGFPEEVALAYRERGYHFLSLTEHNVFADDPNQWRPIRADEGAWPPNISTRAVETYKQKVGEDHVELRAGERWPLVRLKTFAEIQARYESPGSFILLPGVELTAKHNDLHLHMNYINLPVTLPSLKGHGLVKTTAGPATISELVDQYTAEIHRIATERNAPYVVILNHPFWRYYDVLPQALIDNPAIRLFDVCNDGSEYAPHADAPGYDLEKFWDTVNAFRAIRGQPLLYATGVDDAHYYDEARSKKNGGLDHGWVMVRAKRLAADDLLAAIKQGDFYASNGVSLEDVSFSPEDRTLRVKVQAQPGVKYRIHFVTTKRGFDQTATPKMLEKVVHAPARTVMLYSDDIGRVVKAVEGTQAAYQLAEDDLYVRARVESDRPSPMKMAFYPLNQSAWTQPYPATPSAVE